MHSSVTSAERIHAAARENYLWSLVSRTDLAEDVPLLLAEGEGVHVRSIDGDRYLDLMSTNSRAASLGYGRESIARAVYEQLGRLHYAGCGPFQADVTIELAARLAELAPGRLSRTAFVSSGSEANEVAFKLARLYHKARGVKPNAYKVIARSSEYHGAVGGSMAASDWLGVRHPFEPGVPGFSRVPAPTSYRSLFPVEGEALGELCADLLEAEILEQGPDLVAAFILEPVMQANGVQVPPPGYMRRVRDICTRYDVLFVADEVITGFGRTGEWFGMQHWDVEPDIMTTAKAITGGFIPLGAATVTADIADMLDYVPDIHTYSGHPAAAAAALAAIAIYEEEDLVARARELGATLLDRLEHFRSVEMVGDVRGIGMWAAVDFTSDREARAYPDGEVLKQIVSRTRQLGVLVSRNGSCVELAPPLVIAREDLMDGLERFERAVREVTGA
jgi:putrescine---pyruvate transaminase